MILCKADITSKNELKVKKYLKNYEHVVVKLQALEEKDRVRNFQPPVSGEMIMKCYGIGPCAQVGIIKNAIKDAILDGVIQNNEEEAAQFMHSKAQELGLTKV
jgi:poly(A) polymerase